MFWVAMGAVAAISVVNASGSIDLLSSLAVLVLVGGMLAWRGRISRRQRKPEASVPGWIPWLIGPIAVFVATGVLVEVETVDKITSGLLALALFALLMSMIEARRTQSDRR